MLVQSRARHYHLLVKKDWVLRRFSQVWFIFRSPPEPHRAKLVEAMGERQETGTPLQLFRGSRLEVLVHVGATGFLSSFA